MLLTANRIEFLLLSVQIVLFLEGEKMFVSCFVRYYMKNIIIKLIDWDWEKSRQKITFKDYLLDFDNLNYWHNI